MFYFSGCQSSFCPKKISYSLTTLRKLVKLPISKKLAILHVSKNRRGLSPISSTKIVSFFVYTTLMNINIQTVLKKNISKINSLELISKCYFIWPQFSKYLELHEVLVK